MKQFISFFPALVLLTLTASAQGAYPDRIVIPGIDRSASGPWLIVADVNLMTGELRYFYDNTASTSGSTVRSDVEIVASNPSNTSEYFRHGQGKSTWWIRIDTDGEGKSIRVWGQDQFGRFWILKGSDAFPPTPGATPGDPRPAVQ